MLKSLNILLFNTKQTDEIGRNQVIMSFDASDKEITGVSVDGGKKSLLDQIFKRNTGRHSVIVTMGQSIHQPDIVVNCHDVASDVKFTLTLKLDLETPGQDDKQQLRQLVHAFRSELIDQSNLVANTTTRGPAEAFEDEIAQWLRSTYQRKQSIPRFGQSDWVQSESQRVEKHIEEKFGLQVSARLRAELIGNYSLAPEMLTIQAETSDSKNPVELKVRIGCKLQANVSPISVSKLDSANFKSGIKKLVISFFARNVTLQEFRSSQKWKEGLKTKIIENLARHKRTPVGLLIESVESAIDYDLGPFHIAADRAKFVPLGWVETDAILFSSKAELRITDAGKFEAAFSEKSMLKTEVFLTQWFKVALQGAINSSLHEINKSERGYAALLTGWKSKYRYAIEKDLEERAAKIGVSASTIIAKPDCEEMQLVDGIPLQMKGLRLPAEELNATLDFDLDIDISTSSFDNISKILNASKSPIDHIKRKIILPVLERLAKNIGYIDFNLYFDRPPANAKEEGSSNQAIIEYFRKVCEVKLKNAGLKLESFRMTRIQTEHWSIFNALSSAGSEWVKFKTPYFAYQDEDGKTQISDEFKIHFMLSIDSLSAEHVGKFFGRDWKHFKAQKSSYYLAVVETVKEAISSFFTADDIEVLNFGNLKGLHGRQPFEKLVNDYLNRFLSENFGLVGSATAISIKPPKTVVALKEIRDETIDQDKETRLAKIKLSGKMQRKQLEMEEEETLKLASAAAVVRAEEAINLPSTNSVKLLSGAEDIKDTAQESILSSVSAPKLSIKKQKKDPASENIDEDDKEIIVDPDIDGENLDRPPSDRQD
ncbi:MAG: hypothetical protein ABJO86_19185 [Lentilitoribacter sp.]